MAAAWVEADFHAVLRLAHMRDALGRDAGQPSLHAQVTALEDRLGLSPKARRQLQWEIEQAVAANEGEERTLGRRRHLRAVK
jgi:hypothetical protein